MRRMRMVVGAAAVVLLAGCGGSSGGGSASGTTTSVDEATTTTAAAAGGSTTTTDSGSGETTTTAKAGSRPGLYDFNEDGEKELTCGTADFKAGLVLRTYCDDLSGYVSEAEAGATFVKGSLRSLPGPPLAYADDILSGASADLLQAETADGKPVIIVTISSDTTFATGSADLQEPAKATFDSLATKLSARYPGATVQVRGHTDSVGSPASNQTLSERRAAAVAAYITPKGFGAGKVTSVGLGQTVPNYEEKKPDGSVNTVGQAQNRRIELVVRPA